MRYSILNQDEEYHTQLQGIIKLIIVRHTILYKLSQPKKVIRQKHDNKKCKFKECYQIETRHKKFFLEQHNILYKIYCLDKLIRNN